METATLSTPDIAPVPPTAPAPAEDPMRVYKEIAASQRKPDNQLDAYLRLSEPVRTRYSYRDNYDITDALVDQRLGISAPEETRRNVLDEVRELLNALDVDPNDPAAPVEQLINKKLEPYSHAQAESVPYEFSRRRPPWEINPSATEAQAGAPIDASRATAPQGVSETTKANLQQIVAAMKEPTRKNSTTQPAAQPGASTEAASSTPHQAVISDSARTNLGRIAAALNGTPRTPVAQSESQTASPEASSPNKASPPYVFVRRPYPTNNNQPRETVSSETASSLPEITTVSQAAQPDAVIQAATPPPASADIVAEEPTPPLANPAPTATIPPADATPQYEPIRRQPYSDSAFVSIPSEAVPVVETSKPVQVSEVSSANPATSSASNSQEITPAPNPTQQEQIGEFQLQLLSGHTTDADQVLESMLRNDPSAAADLANQFDEWSKIIDPSIATVARWYSANLRSGEFQKKAGLVQSQTTPSSETAQPPINEFDTSLAQATELIRKGAPVSAAHSLRNLALQNPKQADRIIEILKLHPDQSALSSVKKEIENMLSRMQNR